MRNLICPHIYHIGSRYWALHLETNGDELQAKLGATCLSVIFLDWIMNTSYLRSLESCLNKVQIWLMYNNFYVSFIKILNLIGDFPWDNWW